MKKQFLQIIKISNSIIIILPVFIHLLIAQSPLDNFYYFSDKLDSLEKNSIQIKPNYILLSWNDQLINYFSTKIYGRNESFLFFVEPTIVNEPYGPDLLGVDFTRSGINGRITNGFVRYENEIITIQMGRSPLLWGQSINRSIIQSRVTPSYDHMDLLLKFNRFRLEILSGQLGSELLQGERIKRNIAGHRLTWISKNEKLFASFGDQIIYTGKNRGMEWHYLNPFIPYFLSALDGEEETTDTDVPLPTGMVANNDNSILFAEIRYVYKPTLSIIGELLIDDFQVDDNNIQDGLGYKVGIDGAFDISGKPITWALDWTSINSWTYIHHGQYTSWQNKGHALGFPYGPDLKSLHIQADVWVTKALLFNIESDWLEKGSNTLSTEWGNVDNKNDPFPKPPVTNHTLFATSLGWLWKYGNVEIFFQIFCGRLHFLLK